jgi:hypothetical protein
VEVVWATEAAAAHEVERDGGSSGGRRQTRPGAAAGEPGRDGDGQGLAGRWAMRGGVGWSLRRQWWWVVGSGDGVVKVMFWLRGNKHLPGVYREGRKWV